MSNRGKTMLRWLFWSGVFCLSGAVMVASAAWLYLSPQLPSAETYRHVQLETPLRILTADHKLIDEIGIRRDPISYAEIPPMMVNAVLASEDPRFYSHPGVDIRGLARGFYGFIRGINLGGGSTITMQLANNISFDSDNVYARKLKEIPFALRIQQELNKEEILELYLNLIYFGQGADGISAAAYIYYGKPVSELSIAQAAMMTSVLPCPSVCNPVTNPERAKGRRDVVLHKMRAEGMISQGQLQAALAEPVAASRHNRRIEVDAPYVAEMVRQELYQQYGEDIYRGGFEVTTSIHSEKQRLANKALLNGLEEYYDLRHGYRGPENNLPPRGDDPLEYWLEQLNSVPVYGNQHPGIVTSIAERSLEVVMKDGTLQTIDWPGLQWARPYISRDNAWPPPQQAADIASVGDLIRLKQKSDGSWSLGQIPELQGALVSVSPDNGDILALVGGYDFNYSQVNRVFSPRPPGSGFKAFLYGAALENGYSPATLINDAPFTRGDYRPSNFEGNFLGPITLRQAMKDSRNVPAVRLFDQLGSAPVLDFASRFGIDTSNFPRSDLTVALGSQDVTPMSMAVAYATIANGGYKVEPTFIKKITTVEGTLFEAMQPTVCPDCSSDPGHMSAQAGTLANTAFTVADTVDGEEAAQAAIITPPQVADSRVVYILNSMMRSVVEEGSGRRINREIGRNDLKGKTGTTNGPAELWFTGFNRDIATSVFVGFDQPESLGESEQGATVAVPIWIDYMKPVLAGMPESSMPRPDGIVDRLIDSRTGESALPGQSNTMFELFLKENAPAAVGTSENPPGRKEDETLSTEIIF
ncbi:MAG: PBP1A family penicillin-binding protein [Pseudomonadales bacterium]|nr:PBP1A family penicillin-binding protein [Pseudomonadales bacterium]